MAKNNDNRYIQFYTPGTAAVKVQIQDEQKWAPLPEPKPKQKILIPVDPVAMIGFIVAVSMLVMMLLGINQLNAMRREVAEMERYVAQLTAENQNLQIAYENGYNPELIRQKALDMGMVPAEEVPVKHIYVTMPAGQEQEQEKETIPQQIAAFFSDFFA